MTTFNDAKKRYKYKLGRLHYEQNGSTVSSKKNSSSENSLVKFFKEQFSKLGDFSRQISQIDEKLDKLVLVVTSISEQNNNISETIVSIIDAINNSSTNSETGIAIYGDDRSGTTLVEKKGLFGKSVWKEEKV